MKLFDIYRHATEQPNRLAVVNSGREVSYRRFAGMIEILRRYLATRPLPGEGIVAVMGGSLLDQWLLHLALRSLGHTTIGAPSWRTLDDLRLRNLRGVVAFDQAFARWSDDPVAERGCIGVSVPYALLAQADTVLLPVVADEPLAGDHIVFTSGTTGRYKKLLHESRAFAPNHRYNLDCGAAVPPGTVIHLTDFGEWTAAGYLMTQWAWTVGSTVVFDQRADWLEHFFDHPVTMVFLVGDKIARFIDSGPMQPAHYPPIEIRFGGGFIAAPWVERIRQRYRCKLINPYAGTEFTTALASEVKSLDDLMWLEPTPARTLEIVDDYGRPVADGVSGIVRARLHPWEATSYLDEPEATAEHYRDGYFYPGDLAVRREDGRIRILGRTKDVLVVAGAKVPAEPYEERARAVLGVENLCMFSRQSENGAVVLLVVVEGEELPDAARRQELAQLYRGAFSEARFASISIFPRGTAGMAKVNRQAVLDIAEGRVPATPVVAAPGLVPSRQDNRLLQTPPPRAL